MLLPWPRPEAEQTDAQAGGVGKGLAETHPQSLQPGPQATCPRCLPLPYTFTNCPFKKKVLFFLYVGLLAFAS